MSKSAHLWAVGFDDINRADEVRAEIVQLGDTGSLILLDAAVAVRYADGIVTLNGEPFVSIQYSPGHSFARFLAGLALGAPPLTAPAVAPWKGLSVVLLATLELVRASSTKCRH